MLYCLFFWRFFVISFINVIILNCLRSFVVYDLWRWNFRMEVPLRFVCSGLSMA